MVKLIEQVADACREALQNNRALGGPLPRSLDELYELIHKLAETVSAAMVPRDPIATPESLPLATGAHRAAGAYVLVSYLVPEGGRLELATDALQARVIDCGVNVPTHIAETGDVIVFWRANGMEIGIDPGPPRRVLLAVHCDNILSVLR